MYLNNEKLDHLTEMKKKGAQRGNDNTARGLACKVGNSAMLGLTGVSPDGGVVQRLRLLDSRALAQNLGRPNRHGMQAHHIIPNEIVVESINANLELDLGDIKETFDSPWNGIYLPAINNGRSDLPIHGADYGDEDTLANNHSDYTEAVRSFIGDDLAYLVKDDDFAQNVAGYFREIITDMRTGSNVAEIELLNDIGDYFNEENFYGEGGQTYSGYMSDMLDRYNLNDPARQIWANVHDDEEQYGEEETYEEETYEEETYEGDWQDG